MATGGEQMSADRIEDDVMNELPTLDGNDLQELCELVGVDVKEEVKGKRRDLLKLLMKYLCTEGDGEEGNKMTQWLQIHSHLNPPEKDDGEKKEEAVAVKEEETLETNAKTSQVSDSVKKKTADSSMKKKDDTKSGRVEISRVRLKDFKLSGIIGGEGETALSFSSLEFEIDKARKMGHSDTEICGVVISKVADKELKQFFEMEPDMDLDDVLEMLKSANAEAKDSCAVFTEFTDAYQQENEKVMTFISRLLRLRKQVVKLGKAEGVKYDEGMLAKRGHAVLFGGLRDENIRFALREKCRDNYQIEGKLLIKYAGEVVALEKERKKKLFGKDKQSSRDNSADVNMVNADGNADNVCTKKEKLNPFTKIEELRSDMTAQLNEIKNLVVTHNNRQNENENNNNNNRKRKYKKCPQCVADDKNRCSHCWECGSGDHKRSDCPGNQ